MATKMNSMRQSSYEEEISKRISKLMTKYTKIPRRSDIESSEFSVNKYDMGVILTYEVGSVAEGTTTPISDSDSLAIRTDVFICQTEKEVQEKHGTVFYMDRTGCNQGYTKLKLVKDYLDKDQSKGNSWNSLVNETEITNMGVYLSNKKVVDLVRKDGRFMNLSSSFSRHGPSATMTIDPRESPGCHNHTNPTNVDYAQGFKICSITKEGKEWLEEIDATRMEKPWPSVKTLEKIKSLSCEVVAVGDHVDTFHDPLSTLKWRISYTLWERELMWSYHNVQLHCYVIMKYLLMAKLKKISDDVTSYHLKTVVFWESVNCSSEMFQSSQLLSMLKKCLIRLRKAVLEERLNHFIVRERNLFQTKFKDVKEKQAMLSFLNKEQMMTGPLVSLIFDCIGDYCLKKLWDCCWFKQEEFLSQMDKMVKMN